jgi:hypothetical protein
MRREVPASGQHGVDEGDGTIARREGGKRLRSFLHTAGFDAATGIEAAADAAPALEKIVDQLRADDGYDSVRASSAAMGSCTPSAHSPSGIRPRTLASLRTVSRRCSTRAAVTKRPARVLRDDLVVELANPDAAERRRGS